MTEAVADLESRLNAVQSRLDGELVKVQDAMDSRLADLQGAVDALVDQASGALAEEDLAALRIRLEELAMQSGDLSEMVAALGAASPPEKTLAPATEQASAPADEPAEEEAPGAPGLMPGQTALFADGAVRVFVSRLDPGTNSLRASINGDRKTLREGIWRTVASGDGHCRITLEGLSRNGASISALCGDELPAAEGISPGETTILNDGSLRVFASRVTEDAARLSVNGENVFLAAGDRATVMAGAQSCRLTLAQVDRAHATVGAECTDAVWQSAELGAGEAAILGDGAARVFVSLVQPDGTARIAVNGLALSTAQSGQTTAMADNCDLTVSDVFRRAAQFSFACYN
ncbi:hypothetical protein PVW48_11760 [Dinoroseobacter sp. PD6]|uniref:hypothetical protein n=1 Tax=Dinoroseobacter sp. PD6 TaxID=3028384 RepID=UPI00237A85F7|nr:hypothetical protein [Dinoroseobacter sp. PD6]MDD9717426.1 hypothetical protein [Dinoroseobacter sp. PD6]